MKNQQDLVKLWFEDDFNLNTLAHQSQILSKITSLEDKGDKYFDRLSKKIILASRPSLSSVTNMVNNDTDLTDSSLANSQANNSESSSTSKTSSLLFSKVLTLLKTAFSKLKVLAQWLGKSLLAFLLFIFGLIAKFGKAIVNLLKSGFVNLYRKVRKPKQYSPTTHIIRNGAVQFESDKLDPAPIEVNKDPSESSPSKTLRSK